MSKRFCVVLLSELTGPMKRMLLAHLSEAGIPTEAVSFAYVLAPPDQPKGAYDRPTAAQLAEHRAAFREALTNSEAEVVLAVGPEAFRAVTGLTWRIDDARGYIILPEDCKKSVEVALVQEGEYKSGPRKGQPKMVRRKYPAPPPLPAACEFLVASISLKQFIKQKRRQVTAFMASFQAAAAYASGEPLVDEGFVYETAIVEGAFIRSASVAFDIETPMHSQVIDRFSLTMHGLPDGSPHTYTLPWGEGEKRFLQAVLDKADMHVAHNIQFDEPILRANGVTVPEPWFDTMICARLLEPDLPMGLGPTAPIYALTRPWKHLSDERGFADPEYSAKDAFMEAVVFEEQWKALEEWGMLELFTKRMMPSVKALIDMREKGLRVDPVRVEQWCAGLRSELGEHMNWWFAEVPGVNPGSNSRDLPKLLYQTWGLPVQRSKHDGYTTDELALRTLMDIAEDKREPLEHLLEIRRISKLLKTYGRALSGGDRIYPSYLPSGKDETKGAYEKNKVFPGTGRLASSGPNIQNQPDDSRALIVPDDPSLVFVAGDYSQAELRVMAARSGDLELARALQGDIHARTMELVGCSRTLAKNGIYGTSYGAGPKRLVDTMRQSGVYTTEKAMKDFQQALARAYPRWWAYLQTQGEIGQAQGYLRNALGRVRRFTNGGGDVPAMKDFEPQSTVGDIGWSTYRELHDAAKVLEGRLSMLVHDEVVVQVPRHLVHEAADMLRDVMQQPFPEVGPGFYLPIDVTVGERWAKKMTKLEDWK